jgi:hypothetical protein
MTCLHREGRREARRELIQAVHRVEDEFNVNVRHRPERGLVASLHPFSAKSSVEFTVEGKIPEDELAERFNRAIKPTLYHEAIISWTRLDWMEEPA